LDHAGLIDIHTHGALGHTFNEPTVEAFETICAENAHNGVTSLCAAIAPAPLPDLIECFKFIRSWQYSDQTGVHVLGAYLESPYTNVAHKDALDLRYLRLPDDGSADELLEFADVLRVFMLAPELPGAIELVTRINRLGIVPAAGHSSAYDIHVRACGNGTWPTTRHAHLERDVERGARRTVAQARLAGSGVDL
jgi:N-acetylglucosamine-6-phosphate deacetylase